MFKKLAYIALALAFVPAMIMANFEARAAVEIGKPAPEITAKDINGNDFNLEDYKGKTVVLEWTNHQCPFVVKHYGTGNMQAAQKKATESGVIWVSIVSSAPDKQGFLTPEDAIAINQEQGSNATTKILDPLGEIGKAYAAKTTPHMFVIDPDGNIAYKGAIDDNPSANASAVEGAKNLVLAALDDLAAGKEVEVSETAPYGCSVKY